MAITNYQPGGNLHDASVLVYERNSAGQWSQTATVQSPYASTEATSRFASDIDIDGQRILVGDDRANISNMSDDIMTFIRNVDGTWQLEQEFNSGGTVFGEELVLQGNRLAAVDFDSVEIWEFNANQTWILRDKITFDGDLRSGLAMTDQRIIVGHDFNSNTNKLPNDRAVHLIDLRKAFEEKDIDSDGMGDLWETLYGLNISNASDSSLDNDNDSLTNLTEYQLGTDPLVVDTDGDLISDNYEVNNNLNPLDANDASADPDNDSLSNLEEFNLKTNAQSADTDNDGMVDAFEVANGFDPLNNIDGGLDNDNDGFTNAEESQQNRNPFDPQDYPIVFTQRFEAPVATNETRFGRGIAYNEITQQLFVGAEEDNGNGVVYIYTNSNGQWLQTGQLTAADGELQDRFGRSVTVSDNYLFIAAIGDDDISVDTGAVYVFEHQGNGVWSQQSKLTSGGTLFSTSLSTSHGKFVAANNKDKTVYIYEYIAGQWQSMKLTLPAELTTASSMQVAYENNRIIVSGTWLNQYNRSRGIAFILEDDGFGHWQSYQLYNPNQDSASSNTFAFGSGLHIAGDWAMVGDSQVSVGTAYLYRKLNNDWQLVETFAASDGVKFTNFGASVSYHNNRVLVGANGSGENNQLPGAFYAYDKQADGSWKETKIQRSTGFAYEGFGEQLLQIGNTAVATAIWINTSAGTNAGAVYSYDMPAVPTPVIDYFGTNKTALLELDPLTLSWSVDATTATAVSIEGVATNLAFTGTYDLTANTQQTDFTLVVDTNTGQLRKTIHVDITQYPQPIIAFYTSNDEMKINTGQSVSVRAFVQHASQVRIIADTYEQIVPIGFNNPLHFTGYIEALVSPGSGTSYTLEVTNPAGVVLTRSFRVEVDLPQIDLMTPLDQLYVPQGQNYQIDWNISDAYRVEMLTSRYNGNTLVETFGPTNVALGTPLPFSGYLSTGSHTIDANKIIHYVYAYNEDDDAIYKSYVVQAVNPVVASPTININNAQTEFTIMQGDVLTLSFSAEHTSNVLINGGNLLNVTMGSGSPTDSLTFDYELTPFVTSTYTITAYGPGGNTSTVITVYVEEDTTLDADEDGLPDFWEINFYGDLSANANDDFDYDGISNLEEYNRNTDPTDINSCTGVDCTGDSDNDHMPDAWEQQHFGNLGKKPFDNEDGDGLSNVMEFRMVTDPNNLPNCPDGTCSIGEEQTSNLEIGATAGSFSVNYRGEASYRLPVSMQAGVNSFTPRLSLAYNSHGKDDIHLGKRWGDNVLGVGWELQGASVIQRCSPTGSDHMEDIHLNDRDRLCLNGSRLVKTSAMPLDWEYWESGSTYRLQSNPYTRVTKLTGIDENGASIDWFKVELQSGEIMEFGRTALTHITALNKTDQADTEITYVWALNKSYDRFNNQIHYEYLKDESSGSGQYYLHRITYADVVVTLNYQTRADLVAHHFANDEAYNIPAVFLDNVSIEQNNRLLREYQLRYEYNLAGSAVKNLLLNSVQLCAYDEYGNNRECVESAKFNWLELGATDNLYADSVIDEIVTAAGVSLGIDYKMVTDPAVNDTSTGNGCNEIPTDPGPYASVYDDIIQFCDNYYVVSDTYQSNGIGVNTIHSQYQYEGGIRNTKGFGFLGFNKQRITNINSGIQTLRFYNQHSSIGTKLAGREIIDTNTGVLLFESRHVFAQRNFSRIKSSYLNYSWSRSFELDGSPVSAKHMAYHYDYTGGSEYENFIKRLTVTTSVGKELSFANSSGLSVLPFFFVDGAHTKVTKIVTDFSNDKDKWLLGFATGISVTLIDTGDGTAGSVKESTVLTHNTQLPNTLAIDVSTQFPGDINYELSIDYDYDAVGNMTSSTVTGVDIPSRTVALNDFLVNRYPQTVKNALNQTQKADFDTRFGAVKSLTDANNLTVNLQYDNFGRIAYQSNPDNSEMYWEYERCVDTVCPNDIEAVYKITSAMLHPDEGGRRAIPAQIVYQDKLGRTLRVMTEHFNADSSATIQWRKVDTVYDQLGGCPRIGFE